MWEDWFSLQVSKNFQSLLSAFNKKLILQCLSLQKLFQYSFHLNENTLLILLLMAKKHVPLDWGLSTYVSGMVMQDLKHDIIR